MRTLENQGAIRVEQAFRPLPLMNADRNHSVEQAFRPAVKLPSLPASAAKVKLFISENQ
jgi:hypothetical protein